MKQSGLSKGKGSSSKGPRTKPKPKPSKPTGKQSRSQNARKPPIDGLLGPATAPPPVQTNHQLISVGLAEMEEGNTLDNPEYSAVGASNKKDTFTISKRNLLFIVCMVFCCLLAGITGFVFVSDSADSSNDHNVVNANGVDSSMPPNLAESKGTPDPQSLPPQPALDNLPSMTPDSAESLSPLSRTVTPMSSTNGPSVSTNGPSRLTVSPTDRTDSPTDKTDSPTDQTDSPTHKTNSPEPPAKTKSPCQSLTPQVITPQAPVTAPKTGRPVSGSVTDRVDKLPDPLKSREMDYGSWGNYKYCNRGSYATGFKLKVEDTGGDDTAANAFRLICDDGKVISAENDAQWGDWKTVKCNNGQAIKGFATQVEGDRGSGDDTALNSVRAYCTDQKEILIESPGKWGKWADNPSYCPRGSIVCGFKQNVEGSQGGSSVWSNGGDDTALNAVRLVCCSNSKSYSNGEGSWDPVYTGNSGLSFSQKITFGMEDYQESSITKQNSETLEKSLSMNMGFNYKGVSGGMSASLKSTVSSSVTSNSVNGRITTQTEEIEVSCKSNDGTKYYGLYQFYVSAKEAGLNQNPFTFKVRTTDYWCSTVPNQAPKCPPGYCNFCDNCQTCIGDIY